MTSYMWLKALHLIAMVAWFAGMFYIFRLFVYHIKFWDEPKMREAYTLMERKLIYIIMYPAMVVTIIFGLGMVGHAPSMMGLFWFQAKMACLLGLIAYQLFATSIHKRLALGEKALSEKACRFINEIPTILLIAMILLAVLKPS